MSGGNQYIDRITMNLRNYRTGDVFPVFINVFDTSLARKWLSALDNLLQAEYHLEKNYCFVGFHNSDRDLEFMCKQINASIQAINNSDLDYKIDDLFTPENTMHDGEVGSGLPGLTVNHNKFNWLHRYFEDLQGSSGNMSSYYLAADAETRWHIRQLNLLCHEAECWILSKRKSVQAPDWRRPSQLMCWLNAPRFKLDESDLDSFGIERLSKPMGGVCLGVNKAVGKHHWEVFNDEGADSRIDELTTTNMASQTEAAGDFDIEWAQETKGYQFFDEKIDQFRTWLVANGFDPEDPALTLGHPQVGEVDLGVTFGSENHNDIWNSLTNYLDVYSISTSKSYVEYPYHWSDDNYMQQQVEKL